MQPGPWPLAPEPCLCSELPSPDPTSACRFRLWLWKGLGMLSVETAHVHLRPGWLCRGAEQHLVLVDVLGVGKLSCLPLSSF